MDKATEIGRIVGRVAVDTALDVGRKTIVKAAIGRNEERQAAVTPYDSGFPPTHFTSNYSRYGEGEEVVIKTQDGLSLQIDHVLIDTSRTKRVVQTAINGVVGTIKEWISDGDILINMRVIIVGERGSYPKQMLVDLQDFLTINQSLTIINKHLNDVLKVTRVVITGWRHTPEPWTNIQEVFIDAIQDDTYIIEEKIMKK